MLNFPLPTRNHYLKPFLFNAFCSANLLASFSTKLQPLSLGMKIYQEPNWLLQDCRFLHHPILEQGFQPDVQGFFDNFLNYGVELGWEEIEDPYFSSYRDYQTRNRVCGFNSIDLKKKGYLFVGKNNLSICVKLV